MKLPVNRVAGVLLDPFAAALGRMMAREEKK